MKNILFALSLLLLLSCSPSQKKNDDDLKNNILTIIDSKKATVGVALIVDGKDTLTINNEIHYPMQSVYKFHLALAVLNYMNLNKMPFDIPVYIKKSDLLPDTHSPLRDDHPEGEMEMPVTEVLQYTVSKSDNNGCDILFRLLGGPKEVDRYIKSLGISEVNIAATEEEMHSGWEVQFWNWTTPLATVELLEKFRTGDVLPMPYHDFLWKTMVETSTGANKIKALLPEGTIVAHKTGSSFRNDEGIKAAENDIAVVQLPDGRYYSLAIFVSDSKESDETNCRIIAEISKAIYDHLTKK
nr:VEB-PER [uncultured bacterium]AMP50775.1 VEB-PER [uncultured bacterium]